MSERSRKEERGEECRLAVKPEWSIATIEGILRNDFYIGTLRQGKLVVLRFFSCSCVTAKVR